MKATMRLFRKSKREPEFEPERVIRCRSLPSAHHFRFAVGLCAIHYLCLITMLTTAVMLILYPDQRASKLLIATTAATIATWFLALLRRRVTLCPLCKGTPLVESGALLHERAKRLAPLPHGVSTILSILFLQRFRCMYCGTDYDMLKESTRHHSGSRPKRRFIFFKQDE
jgi:hypothetical protein